MSATRSRGSAVALAIIACAAFAGSGPVAKSVMEAGVDPGQAAWMRLTGAAIVIVPIVLILRGRAFFSMIRRAWPALLGYGLVGMAASQGLYFLAAQRLPVGVAILLQFSGPLLIIGWTVLVRHRKVPRSAFIGVVVSLIGLAIVVEVWAGVVFDVIGLLAGVGAAVCQATYFLMIEGMTESIDVLGMTAAGTAVAAVALTVVTQPWNFPWKVLAGPVTFGGSSLPGWVLALWLILVCAVVAYVTEGIAVRRLSAVIGAAVAYVEVVFAAVFAFFLLGEALGPAQILGGVLVLAGAYVAQRPQRGQLTDLQTATEIEFPGLVASENGQPSRPESTT